MIASSHRSVDTSASGSPSEWIDISVPVRSGMIHWPGDPAVVLERTKRLELGDSANVSRLDMGAHTGTHMDSPFHYLQGGARISEMPLSATLGPARVVQVEGDAIERSQLERAGVCAGERLLFKTRNSRDRWFERPFDEDYVYVAEDAARLLAERGVQAIGIDYLSVGGFREDGAAVHRILLGAGIWLIEGLDLAGVEPGNYELVCLPLKLAGADGAPARAVLRPLSSTPP